MAHAFVGRISRPFSDISGVLITWSQQCKQMWVYEHESDEKVTRTHCHILTFGSEAFYDTLKERKNYVELGFKGNSDHSFKKYKPQFELQYLTYMTKGVLQPKLVVGDKGEAAQCMLNWKGDSKVKPSGKPQAVHWDVIEEIRKNAPKTMKLVKDEFGYMYEAERYLDLDSLMLVINKTLDKYKIRTSEHDYDRWLFTLIRDDPLSNSSRRKFHEKYHI